MISENRTGIRQSNSGELHALKSFFFPFSFPPVFLFPSFLHLLSLLSFYLLSVLQESQECSGRSRMKEQILLSLICLGNFEFCYEAKGKILQRKVKLIWFAFQWSDLQFKWTLSHHAGCKMKIKLNSIGEGRIQETRRNRDVLSILSFLKYL